MATREYKVPEDLWNNYVKAVETQVEVSGAVRDAWEGIAESLGLIAPTMSVTGEGLVEGEPVPSPELSKDKSMLLLVDRLRDLSVEDQKKVMELVAVAPVRLLGHQVEKLYDGWTLDAAYSVTDEEDAAVSNGTVAGKIIEALEGE